MQLHPELEEQCVSRLLSLCALIVWLMVAGGSATNPEGDLVVRLFDGAIGPTQLSQAQAVASLNAAQRLNFSMDLAPAEPRVGGFARVTGSVPLASSSNKPAGLVLCICVQKIPWTHPRTRAECSSSSFWASHLVWRLDLQRRYPQGAFSGIWSRL